MKVSGKGSTTNVPIHGTIEKRVMNMPDGKGGTKPVEKALVALQGTMSPETAQTDPALAKYRFEGKDGKSHYGMSQICSVDQFDKIKEAAGAQAVELHDKDGKATGKYAVAFSANLVPNASGTGYMPNTKQPMGPNPIAQQAGFTDEKSAKDFMAGQREIAKAAGEMRKAYIEQNGLDMKKPEDRARVPDVYDVSGSLNKTTATPVADKAAPAPEKAEAPKKARTARKLPDAPEAPAAEAESEAAFGE